MRSVRVHYNCTRTGLFHFAMPYCAPDLRRFPSPLRSRHACCRILANNPLCADPSFGDIRQTSALRPGGRRRVCSLAGGGGASRRRLRRLPEPAALRQSRRGASARGQTAARGCAPKTRSRARGAAPAGPVPDRRRHRQTAGRALRPRRLHRAGGDFHRDAGAPDAARRVHRHFESQVASVEHLQRRAHALYAAHHLVRHRACTPGRGPAIRPRTAASACRRISPSGCFTRPRSARA